MSLIQRVAQPFRLQLCPMRIGSGLDRHRHHPHINDVVRVVHVVPLAVT